MWNDSGKYEDRWVRLQTEGENCVFLRGIDRLELPVAHAEGKFVARDPETLAGLESRQQLCLRYDGHRIGGQIAYPENPNGSQADVAGVCDETGRVFGLMPHPERNIDATHHPQWTRRPLRTRRRPADLPECHCVFRVTPLVGIWRAVGVSPLSWYLASGGC
jgi:phosphoribosylformylglycinamidine synthase subunit PurQ / glutaminase